MCWTIGFRILAHLYKIWGTFLVWNRFSVISFSQTISFFFYFVHHFWLLLNFFQLSFIFSNSMLSQQQRGMFQMCLLERKTSIHIIENHSSVYKLIPAEFPFFFFLNLSLSFSLCLCISHIGKLFQTQVCSLY